MYNIPMPLDDSRSIWDQRYDHARQTGTRPHYEPWLERWRDLLPPGSRVLDLGCGSGQDTGWLNAAGYAVTAGDFSFSALQAALSLQSSLAMRIASSTAPSAAFLQLDLRDGLPFAPAAFSAVIANLCLHYFPWAHTVELVRQVRGCLPPGGTLLARFNSTRDANFGAQGYPQVEPNAYLVNGLYKRYFDRPSLEELFSTGWQVLNIEEMTINRYGPPKVLWEVAAKRAGDDSVWH